MAENAIPLDEFLKEVPKKNNPDESVLGLAKGAVKKAYSENIEPAVVGFGRGAFPLADEAGALIMSLVEDGMSYGEAKEYYKKEYSKMEKRSPIISTTSQLAGAMAIPIPGAAPSKAIKNAGALAKALGLSKSVAKNAIKGSAFGAAYGAAEGDTTEERISNALWGGAFGAGGSVFSRAPKSMAEKTAIKAIARNEMAIEKMAAFVPGGKQKLGRFLIDESFLAPIGGLKKTIKRIDGFMPKLQKQYDSYIDLASEKGGNVDMMNIYKDVYKAVIMPLEKGDTRAERTLAKKLSNFFPGWAENPTRNLKEANKARQALDDVLAETYLNLKSAKIAGSKGPLLDRKLAEIRGIFNNVIDSRIDDALESVASEKSYGVWAETKATYQMLLEAKQAAIQKLGKAPGISSKELILSTVMPLNRYSAAWTAANIGGGLAYGRAGAVAAKGLESTGKLMEKAGPLAAKTKELTGEYVGEQEVEAIPLDEFMGQQ